MKLRRLTINNIASIRNAEIDFTAEPLASSSVYLISGVTGSGKTTILDAICLALYANTPRLRNLSKNGHNKDTVEVEDSKTIAFTDVRNMVRRDAEIGSVALEFTGNDGVDYTAEWSAARPRRKLGKPLMTPNRCLTFANSDGSETVLTKNLEINARILRAVGLDFDKFCRTTMLAQGDFTRFLHARNEEKSEILEKITGTGIYKRIGMGIRESYKERKDAVAAVEQQLERTNVLPESELQRLKEEIASLSQLSAELTERGKVLASRRAWLDNDKRLAAELMAKQETANLAKEEMLLPAIESKRKLLADHEATSEPRRVYAEATAARVAMQAADCRLESLRNEYAALRAGTIHASGRVVALNQKHAELSALIEKLKPHASIYEHAPAIAEKLSALTRFREQATNLSEEISAIRRTLAETLVPAYGAAVEKYNQCVAHANAATADVAAAEAQLESYGIDSLRAAKERLLNTRSEIQKSLILLQLKAGIERQTLELVANRRELSVLVERISALTAARDFKKAAYERERESIDALIRKLRTELTVGCSCPLCRQTVDALPDEAAIDTLVATAERAFRDAEAELALAVDSRNRLEAKIAASQKQIDTQSAGLPEVISVPEQALEEVNAELKMVEQRIKAAEAEELKLKETRTLESRYRTELQAARDLMDTCTRSVQAASGNIDTKSEQLKAAGSEAERTAAEVSYLLRGYPMPFSATERPEQFSRHLVAEAEDFKRACQTSMLLEAEIAESKTTANRNEALLASIEQWQELPLPQPQEVPDLDSRIVALLANVKSANDAMQAASATILQSEEYIKEFLHRTAMPEVVFNQLCEIGADEITQARADVESAAKRLAAAEATLAAATKAIEEHHTAQPAGIEHDTEETLGAQATDISEKIEEINQQIGAKRQEVESDEKFRKERGQLLADLEAKRAEAAKWQELDALFGDTDGKKFSTIAQSYVLMDLIDSANRYMTTLTDRYKLRVEPNSFIISVEDAYDGFKPRATNTISGGESFLVSLALALALSDIAENLEVDNLFIDEGFGSLSGEALQDAITTLQQLHTKTGRHVGIISHVDELREQIPVQILVERNSRTSVSRVTVNSKTCF